MKAPVTCYHGNDPYIFVCYAHADADDVYPLINYLGDQGVNVWYDEGIGAGSEWTQVLADAIDGCSHVIFFCSGASIRSEHCRRELNFAQAEGREVVAVHLEQTDMPSGLRLALNNRQALLRHELEEAEFLDRLSAAALADGLVPAASTVKRIAPRQGLRTGLIGFSLAALLGVSLLVGWPFLSRGTAPGGQTPIPNSIAVLPFENLSAEEGDAFVAAGLHDTVLHELSKVSGLNVIARSTMVQYSDTAMDVAQVAAELRAQHVLEGSVQLSGSMIQVRVSLVQPLSRTTLWTKNYTRPLDDVLLIQREIAEQISSTLAVEILADEAKNLATLLSDSTAAVLFFMKARAITSNLGPSMPPEFYTFLDAAIEEDPDFALAHGVKSMGLVLSLGVIPVAGMDIEAHEKAIRFHAKKAQEGTAAAGYGYAALAMLAEQNGQWAEAESTWRKAIAVAPNEFDILDDYARFMAFRGENEVVSLILARSRDLNPADRQLEAGLAMLQKDYTAALEFIAPHQIVQQAMIYTLIGERDKAIQLLTQISELPQGLPFVASSLCMLYGQNGLPTEAEPHCVRASTTTGLEPLDRVRRWVVASGRRDPEAMYLALQEIAEGGLMGPFYFQFINNSYNDPLMESPEILSLRKRMGFIEQP